MDYFNNMVQSIFSSNRLLTKSNKLRVFPKLLASILDASARAVCNKILLLQSTKQQHYLHYFISFFANKI